MKLIIDKNRKVYSAGTWGTKNENNYEILDFEFPEELENYNKRIVYYLGDERVWDAIVYNKAYITNAITKYEKVNAYVWLTKNETITLKYVCDGTEEGNYYFTYDNANYYFTMPEVEENDELIFDVATSTLKLDNTTIATTSTGTGTELTFETIIDAEEDFRTQLFEMQFYENENASGIVPTEEQVDGFNTMLTAMNAKIDEVDALETTIETAEAERQEAEATRVSNENTRETNESTRQTNEQTRQSQEADRERRTNEAISSIQDKTAEYNANAEAKTTAFNNNATQKTNEFNSNYTQKVNDFNSNASSKETAFNSNASSKTSAFNSNAETKTNAFNTNATNKTNDFNSNATEKTTAFDNNASTKTSEFNTNAESKTSAFNDNATQKTTNFDNNASDKTTDFNNNAQAKTEAFDEHTEEMQQEIDELSANMPWGETEQATEISVDDAAKYSRNRLELFGNTEQAQYTGKNLFSGWEEGLIDPTTGEEYIYAGRYRSRGYIEIKLNTNYYFSMLQPSSAQSFWVYIYKYDENKQYIGRQPLKDGAPQAYANIVNISDTTTKYIRFTEIASAEYINETQFELGTERTSYEPYVGGGPSPNPDYPQDIHVVTGNNTIGVQGKNLLDLANKTGGTITLRKLPQKLKPGTYTFSCDDTGNSIACRLSETNQAGTPSAVTSTNYVVGTRRYASVTIDFEAEYVNLSTNNQPATNMQIEEGSTATSYVPYYHADYPINLGSIELCKIGDYQDYLYKENGNWYIQKNTGKTILGKPTTGNLTTDYTYNYFSYKGEPSGIYPGTNIICSHLIGAYNVVDMRTQAQYNNSVYWGSNGTFVRVDKFNTVEEYINALSANDITIIGRARTPTTTQITDETLISQLDEIYEHLQLVKGTNNISITASDLKPYMELSYMQDIKSKLDNLDSRLALLE